MAKPRPELGPTGDHEDAANTQLTDVELIN